jgi:hypothetical protein
VVRRPAKLRLADFAFYGVAEKSLIPASVVLTLFKNDRGKKTGFFCHKSGSRWAFL